MLFPPLFAHVKMADAIVRSFGILRAPAIARSIVFVDITLVALAMFAPACVVVLAAVDWRLATAYPIAFAFVANCFSKLVEFFVSARRETANALDLDDLRRSNFAVLNTTIVLDETLAVADRKRIIVVRAQDASNVEALSSRRHHSLSFAVGLVFVVSAIALVAVSIGRTLGTSIERFFVLSSFSSFFVYALGWNRPPSLVVVPTSSSPGEVENDGDVAELIREVASWRLFRAPPEERNLGPRNS